MQFGGMDIARHATREISRKRYTAPVEPHFVALPNLFHEIGRPPLAERQMDLLRSHKRDGDAGVYYAGDVNLLKKPAVSIVGTREVSELGRKRASRLARELVEADVTVVSGLAKGVDTAALTSAMHFGGGVVAVIGTPLDKAYPAENSSLQETIWRDHLLLTPFEVGEPTYRGNFPKRNRVMAAISDATVIVEASDTSGTLHQAAECGKLGRWLFIMRSVAEDRNLTWPAKFLDKPKVAVLDSTMDILDAIGSRQP